MCGIGGFKRYGELPIDLANLQRMAVILQSRGSQATGVALARRDGSIAVHKDHEIAWKYMSSKPFLKWWDDNFDPEETVTAMVHTRAATLGNPFENKNNHPLYSGEAAIIHNGHISNHEWLFKDLKLERGAETDSDVIRAIVDKYGISEETIKVLCRMSGGAAIAAVFPKAPSKLLLTRSGSPLVLGWNPDDLMLAWASTKDAIYQATKPLARGMEMVFEAARSNYFFHTVQPDTAMIFGPEAKEFQGRFNSAYSNWTPARYDVHGTHREKTKRFKREQEETNRRKKEPPLAILIKELAEGGKCWKCNEPYNIPPKYKNLPLWQLTCGECKETLGVEPK